MNDLWDSELFDLFRIFILIQNILKFVITNVERAEHIFIAEVISSYWFAIIILSFNHDKYSSHITILRLYGFTKQIHRLSTYTYDINLH